MKNFRWLKPISVIVLAGSMCTGCGTIGGGRDNGEPLRVGVSPNYPPVIFKRDDRLAGLEVDFAVRLAQELGRPIRFVEVEWGRQIQALLDGETDIIMSGLSVTPAREVRVAFTDAYFTNGLVALMRTPEAGRFQSVEQVLESDAAVGVQKGTTGEIFVQANMPGAKVYALRNRDDVIHEFERRRISLYIDDAAAAAYIVSRNEGELTGLWVALAQEPMAWAVSRSNPELLTAANAALDRWQADGTADRILRRWLPFMPAMRD